MKREKRKRAEKGHQKWRISNAVKEAILGFNFWELWTWYSKGQSIIRKPYP